MNEKELMTEIKRLKDETSKNRNELLAARGFVRSAEQQRTREGIALWEALPPEEKNEFERAAQGTGMPGSGIFFLGYRKKPA